MTVLRQAMIEAMRQHGFAQRTHTTYLTVITDLARYSNARILAVDDDRQVTLRYKDYRDRDRRKQLVLDGEEFVRRFLLHVLPKGLMRVRHYGFLANRCRRRRLAQIRQALAVAEVTPDADSAASDPRCLSR